MYPFHKISSDFAHNFFHLSELSQAIDSLQS